MLDQLKIAINTAQRLRQNKSYTFRRPYAGRQVELTIDGNCNPTVYDIRPAVYDRFVALANSGEYAIEIMDSDYGVAWQLRRKSA